VDFPSLFIGPPPQLHCRFDPRSALKLRGESISHPNGKLAFGAIPVAKMVASPPAAMAPEQ
jgi:hypothetical protein